MLHLGCTDFGFSGSSQDLPKSDALLTFWASEELCLDFNIMQVLLVIQPHGEGCEELGKPPLFTHLSWAFRKQTQHTTSSRITSQG